MMKKVLLAATLVTAATVATVVGCGSTSSSNPPGGTDSGTPPGTTGGTDAGDGGIVTGNPDGSTPGDSAAPSSNPPLPDGAVLPSGTQLFASDAATVTLNGVTSDDYAIYTDTAPATPTVYALSLAAGSKPVTVGPTDANDNVTVIGKVVLLESAGNKNGVGQLSVWTSAASAATSISTSSCSAIPQSGLAAVSADGTEVLYFDGTDTGCNTGTLTVAGANGSGKTALIPSVDLAGNYCYPVLAFGGDHAVAGYCVTGGDAGVVFDAGESDGGTNLNVATVSSFTGPTWTPVPLAVGAQAGIAIDPAGTTVVLVGPTGTVAYPIGGGAAVTIDTTGESGGVTGGPGLLTNDGGTLLYTTTAHALDRAATVTPPDPTQLVAAGTFFDVSALSPDHNWVIGALNAGQYPQSDLYLASATTPGTAVTLSSATTSTLQGDPFTVDSSHALFFTALNGEGTGTFNAQAVTGASTPTPLGTGAFGDFATSGAKVVFDANFDSTHFVADVLSVDTSTTVAPKVLVSVADPYVFLNAEKTLILYTWSYQTGSNAGLWSMPVP